MVQFGYNIGIINQTEDLIEDFVQNVHQSRTNTTLSDGMLYVIWSFVVSFYDIGGMLGGLVSVLITDSVGRKQVLMLINIPGIAGTLLLALSKLIRNYEIIILGRLFIGFHCGLSTVFVPMYLSEISPKTLRGGIGTLTNFGASFGLLMAMILGLDDFLGTHERWPYLFGINVVPSILQLVFLSFSPESPRFLFITKHDESATQNILERLRGKTDINNELEEMRIEKSTQEQQSQMGLFQVLCNKDFKLPLLISVVMQLSVQYSGIIIILYYSTKLFTFSGISIKNAGYATAGLGTTIVIMSIVSIPLVDHAGRRVLHLYGLGGMFIFGIFFTISMVLKSTYKWMPYVTVVSVIFFVIFFSIGPASIPWMIVAELFTHNARSAAMSIAMFVGWFSKILIGLSFPHIQKWLQVYVLLPFTVLLACFWTFTFFIVPETKNKTFVEIAALFKKNEETVET